MVQAWPIWHKELVSHRDGVDELMTATIQRQPITLILGMTIGLSALLATVCVTVAEDGPESGEVYREYKAVSGKWPHWAIIDPEPGNQNKEQYLPNTPTFFNLENLDQALKAEVLVDRWGGHVGTVHKTIRFNQNDWIELPELSTTPKSTLR